MKPSRIILIQQVSEFIGQAGFRRGTGLEAKSQPLFKGIENVKFSKRNELVAFLAHDLLFPVSLTRQNCFAVPNPVPYLKPRLSESAGGGARRLRTLFPSETL
ncbi:MAG: hypothetical protein OXI01_22180 [Albidovulum sp.]|nr:hypothetical protein [Albidovulum sp.]